MFVVLVMALTGYEQRVDGDGGGSLMVSLTLASTWEPQSTTESHRQTFMSGATAVPPLGQPP